MCWVDVVSALGVLTAGVGAIIALIFAFLAWRNTRHNLFISLWQEYSSPEMFNALSMLYGLWRESQGDPSRVVDKYIESYKYRGTKLHEERRRVSHFYQRLALLKTYRLIPRRFKRRWFGLNLESVAILHPIETVAIPEMLKGPDFPPSLDTHGARSEDNIRMFEMYNELKKIQEESRPY
jgi:hypothetical protein